MKKFLGFTLSELMVAITVLGIICAAVLPSILGHNPNQNKVMMKKAYYATEEIVEDLINNPTLYPETSVDGLTQYEGFESATSNTFYERFANKLNRIDDFATMTDAKADTLYQLYSNLNVCKGKEKDECINSKLAHRKITSITKNACGGITIPGASTECFAFITNEGMVWYFALDNMSALEGASLTTNILVDVNGDKTPNCYQGSRATGCAQRSDFDQFRMSIYNNGKVEIFSDDVWARDAISVKTVLDN